MNSKKRPFSEKELLEEAEKIFEESDSSEVDFDSDDSIRDPDFQDRTSSSSEDSPSEEDGYLDDASDNNPGNNSTLISEWGEVTGNKQQTFAFVGKEGLNPNLDTSTFTVFNAYSLFVTEDLLETMVIETNRNAQQVIAKLGKPKSKSRLSLWKPVTLSEMRKFLGIVLYMGLVRYPNIEAYWSTHPIYKNNLIPKIMPRNRFQSLLRFWHFSNNQDLTAENSRLYKIEPLVTHFNLRYKQVMRPGKVIAIDESMVPFRGRLKFRQYIPGKRHKYGIKLFKMCDQKGYTYSFSVYQGKGADQEVSLPTSTVMDLCKDFLDEGRVAVNDNFYTSIPLAKQLLSRKTHSVGTLRKNRKYLPKEVVSAKLKKGEIIGRENEDGIVVSKWKDKRDVLMLSTYHNLDVVNTGKLNRKRETIQKPLCIIDYNAGKAGIDLSDQLAAYSSPVRKSVRWYHKVAIELLMGTSVVNALVVYKMVHPTSKMSVTKFRETLVESLLEITGEDEVPQKDKKRKKIQHEMKETEEKCKRNRKIRKRCIYCYKKISAEQSWKLAANSAKRVTTYCDTCPEKPFICIQCFPDHF